MTRSKEMTVLLTGAVQQVKLNETFYLLYAVVMIEITTDQRRSTDVSGRDQATTERPGQIRRHLAGPDDSLGSGSHNLSALDVKILAMVAEGHQIDAIAQCLNFSPRTVRRRLREMCDRLGARAPVQLAVWAARCGII